MQPNNLAVISVLADMGNGEVKTVKLICQGFQVKTTLNQMMGASFTGIANGIGMQLIPISATRRLVGTLCYWG